VTLRDGPSGQDAGDGAGEEEPVRLFYHLVGEREQVVGDIDPESLGGLGVDDQFVLGRRAALLEDTYSSLPSGYGRAERRRSGNGGTVQTTTPTAATGAR
jgi:hypothetical protein